MVVAGPASGGLGNGDVVVRVRNVRADSFEMAGLDEGLLSLYLPHSRLYG